MRIKLYQYHIIMDLDRIYVWFKILWLTHVVFAKGKTSIHGSLKVNNSLYITTFIVQHISCLSFGLLKIDMNNISHQIDIPEIPIAIRNRVYTLLQIFVVLLQCINCNAFPFMRKNELVFEHDFCIPITNVGNVWGVHNHLTFKSFQSLSWECVNRLLLRCDSYLCNLISVSFFFQDLVRWNEYWYALS